MRCFTPFCCTNRFNWTTPVRHLLGPSFKLYDEQLTTQTTLEDILSHRTGIPDYFLLLFAGYPYHITRKQLIQYVFAITFINIKQTKSTDVFSGHDARTPCRVIAKVVGLRQATVPVILLSVKCNFDRLYNHFGFCPCVCVCQPIGCRTITSAILYRFSPNFAHRSEMWLFRTLLFLEQTGSSLPILEMCKIQFWQFRDCGGHIFSQIVIKT